MTLSLLHYVIYCINQLTMDGLFIHSSEFIQIKATYVKEGYITSDFCAQTVCVLWRLCLTLPD